MHEKIRTLVNRLADESSITPFDFGTELKIELPELEEQQRIEAIEDLLHRNYHSFPAPVRRSIIQAVERIPETFEQQSNRRTAYEAIITAAENDAKDGHWPRTFALRAVRRIPETLDQEQRGSLRDEFDGVTKVKQDIEDSYQRTKGDLEDHAIQVKKIKADYSKARGEVAARLEEEIEKLRKTYKGRSRIFKRQYNRSPENFLEVAGKNSSFAYRAAEEIVGISKTITTRESQKDLVTSQILEREHPGLERRMKREVNTLENREYILGQISFLSTVRGYLE